MAKRKRAGSADLEKLIEYALTDDEFVKQLESAPWDALKSKGLSTDPALVREILKIDFEVFRRHGGTGPRQGFC